jgi:hypothetical protein
LFQTDGRPPLGMNLIVFLENEHPPFSTRVGYDLIFIPFRGVKTYDITRAEPKIISHVMTGLKTGLPTIGIESHDRRLQDGCRYISWESTKAEERRQEHRLNSDLEIKNMIWLLTIQSQVPSIARDLSQNHD